MFKIRLKAAMKIGSYASLLTALSFVALIGMIYLSIKLPIVTSIVEWFGILLFSFVILSALVVFINWLFIEPYRYYKINKKDEGE